MQVMLRQTPDWKPAESSEKAPKVALGDLVEAVDVPEEQEDTVFWRGCVQELKPDGQVTDCHIYPCLLPLCTCPKLVCTVDASVLAGGSEAAGGTVWKCRSVDRPRIRREQLSDAPSRASATRPSGRPHGHGARAI